MITPERFKALRAARDELPLHLLKIEQAMNSVAVTSADVADDVLCYYVGGRGYDALAEAISDVMRRSGWRGTTVEDRGKDRAYEATTEWYVVVRL